MRSNPELWNLTRGEIEQWRTCADYLLWMKDIDSKIRSDRRIKESCRIKDRCWKWYFDEGFPLRAYFNVFQHERDHWSILPVLGNQRFDARVTQAGAASFMEISSAYDGYDLALRMEVLRQEGHVPAFGPIRRDSKDRTRIHYESAARSREEVLEKAAGLVSSRLNKKLAIEYAKNTELVVLFDDHIGFDRHESYSRFMECVREFAGINSTDLDEISIVGSKGCWGWMMRSDRTKQIGNYENQWN